MKKTSKIFVSMASLGILLNNVAYATTDTVQEEGGVQIKYIFMGVAALVIVLLLYLGYKMDTKGNNPNPSKVSNKQKKAKEKLEQKAEEIKHNDGVYEEDSDITYEEDEDMDNEDLNEVTEYSEDDEEEGSLYAAPATNENEESLFEENSAPSEEPSVTTPEPPVAPEEPEEDVGEEFDTSLIDSLDDDEPAEKNVNTEKDSFDETMLFNSDDFGTTGASFETGNDGIDSNNVEISEEPEEINVEPTDTTTNILDSNEDSFINELKNFEEPESTFEGFSSAKKPSIKEEKVETVDEPIEEPVEEIEEEKPEEVVKPQISFSSNDDFLSQMEANLQKNKADREAKKASKSTSTETKSKTTTKKYTKKSE